MSLSYELVKKDRKLCSFYGYKNTSVSFEIDITVTYMVSNFFLSNGHFLKIWRQVQLQI